jgi:Uma2 family endonuclease
VLPIVIICADAVDFEDLDPQPEARPATMGYRAGMSQPLWSLDADDPRAPSQEVWERMTSREQQQVISSLPTDMPLDLHPPEGDAHRKPKERARDALDEFFRRVGRRVYVSSELVTYYPGEPRFCPDILAVLDVEPVERQSWIVSKEQKGLDLVIEVHVAGNAEKDFELNVVRYARLGIPEYFIFDRPGVRVLGYRLKPGSTSYERLVPQAGRLTSQVLGLELVVEAGMLRFYHGTAPLLFMDELVSKLNGMLGELVEARDSALKHAEKEAHRADEEARRADALAKELARVQIELDQLRRRS